VLRTLHKPKLFKLEVGSYDSIGLAKLPSERRLAIELFRQMFKQGRIVLQAKTYSDFNIIYKMCIRGASCLSVYVGRKSVHDHTLRHALRLEVN